MAPRRIVALRNECVQETLIRPRGSRRRRVVLARAPLADLDELQALALLWWQRGGRSRWPDRQ